MKVYVGLCRHCKLTFNFWGPPDAVDPVAKYWTRQHMIATGHWVVSNDATKPRFIPVKIYLTWQLAKLARNYLR